VQSAVLANLTTKRKAMGGPSLALFMSDKAHLPQPLQQLEHST
jgi:hypothetical protein